MARVQILETGSTLTSDKAKEMLRDGTAHGKKLTAKQKRYFGYVAGGGTPKAQDGLMVEGNQYTPMTDDSIMINGKKHSEGGTKLSYKGNTVEAESGEPLTIQPDGDAVIYGNLVNPITGNKFKSDAKRLLTKEQKVDKLMDYSTSLVNQNDPYNKWSRLRYNSGEAMMQGAAIKKKELQQSKQHLGDIQQAMLDLSDEMGVDAQKFSQGKFEAKKGFKLNYAQDGTTLSLAQRHNNPGNLKYADWMKKYGAVKGEPGKDGGYFAKFPDLVSGQQAMINLLNSPSYKRRTVGDAIGRWTNNHPYTEIDPTIKDKKIGDLGPQEFNLLLNTITKGEDSKTYNWQGVGPSPSAPSAPQSKYDAGRVQTDDQFSPQEPYGSPRIRPGAPYSMNINPLNQYPTTTNKKGLEFDQIVPELFAAATNRREPVFAQKYQPELYEPYQVSFQDRRNLNNQTFRAVSQRLSDNPAALSQLAAQKYEADNQVNADEFRTNQAIANDITNKNIGLLNDAQNENLQIADTQYTRASKAKSNTKAINQAVVTSIADKIAQNRLENRTLETYQNLYPHYRYDENYQLQKVGAPGYDYTDTSSVGISSSSSPYIGENTRVRTEVDPMTGQTKKLTYIQGSQMQNNLDREKLQNYYNINMNSILKGKLEYNWLKGGFRQ